MKKNCSIIIEARMNSSRLPGKVLYKSKNIPMIHLMLKRLKRSKKVKQIILATTKNKKDNKLVNSIKLPVKFFRGSENNVIHRVLSAAKKYNVEHIVKICGDSPLIDVKIVDKMINLYFMHKPDYMSNNMKKTFPDGMDIEIFPYSTLEKSYHISKTNLNKEHVTYFIRKSNLFKKLNFKANKKNFFPKLKLTLDTYNDYIFLDKIIKSFKGKIHFNCSQIIKKSQFLNK